MSTLKTLKEQEIKTFEGAIKLRTIPFDKNVKDFNKRQKLREQQDDMYNKNKFYKGLLKHWKEENKDENIKKI